MNTHHKFADTANNFQKNASLLSSVGFASQTNLEQSMEIEMNRSMDIVENDHPSESLRQINSNRSQQIKKSEENSQP